MRDDYHKHKKKNRKRKRRKKRREKVIIVSCIDIYKSLAKINVKIDPKMDLFQTMKQVLKKDESIVMAWLDGENSLEISKKKERTNREMIRLMNKNNQLRTGLTHDIGCKW